MLLNDLRLSKSSLTLVLAVVSCLSFGLGAVANPVFIKNCAPCHSKDGKAQTPAARKLGVKDLSQSTIPDQDIIKQIKEGRKDERGEQKMPSFKDKLSEEEIKSLVETVKGFRK